MRKTVRANSNENQQNERRLAEANQLVAQRQREINQLKRELENVAKAAFAEHEALAQQSLFQARRHHEIVEQKTEALVDLQTRFDRYRHEAAEAALLYESDLESLESLITILRTDHETVELICDDLDHYTAKLECQLAELQKEFSDDASDSLNQHQSMLRTLDSMEIRLDANNKRLAIETEEKQSLIQSVSSLKRRQTDHDACLFAKDQEIKATEKLYTESHRQLESLRREHQSVVSQNDFMRNQIRESADTIAELKLALEASDDERDAFQAELNERDRQLKKVQSSSRATDANMMLRISETEQQFAIERDEWESQLEIATAISQSVHYRE